jgi:hypothetical protein
MNRVPASLLLPLLAIAACQPDRMPVMGFFTPPPGSQVLKGDSLIRLEPVFLLDAMHTFRVRYNSQDGVTVNSGGVYNYDQFPLFRGWRTGQLNDDQLLPPATYVVELVDETGQSWGKSEPITIQEGPPGNYISEPATLMFVHYDGQASTWNVDPATQDADLMTAEIIVTNLAAEDMVVERCLSAADGGRDRTCTTVGTIAPGADLRTVETIASPTTSPLGTPSTDNNSALVIHGAANATPTFERPLVSAFVSSCAVERLLVHGARTFKDSDGELIGSSPFATSSCLGY